MSVMVVKDVGEEKRRLSHAQTAGLRGWANARREDVELSCWGKRSL